MSNPALIEPSPTPASSFALFAALESLMAHLPDPATLPAETRESLEGALRTVRLTERAQCWATVPAEHCTLLSTMLEIMPLQLEPPPNPEVLASLTRRLGVARSSGSTLEVAREELELLRSALALSVALNYPQPPVRRDTVAQLWRTLRLPPPRP